MPAVRKTSDPAPSLSRPHHRRIGHYPTAPDVADYLARNTIVPFLLSEVSRLRPQTITRAGSLRSLLKVAGASTITDLVTRNLDLVGLVADWLQRTTDEQTVAVAWSVLARTTVLDPTCGEGALLLAAGRALRSCLEACVTRCPLLALCDASIVERMVRFSLHGVDLRGEAIADCRNNLSAWARTGSDTSQFAANLHVGNAIADFHWQQAFSEVLGRGGFDVILGNPPFLELNEVDYAPANFRTAECGAVHGLCVEQSLRLLQPNGWFGMVLPMAVASTQRMNCVQDLLEEGRSVWYSHYAWRPARLFPAVNRAITLVLTAPDELPRTFSTGYRKWYAEDRADLFPSLRYTAVSRVRSHSWVPKISCELERRLLHRLLSLPTRVDDFLADGRHEAGGLRVYYRCDGGLYWKVFTDFPPAFRCNGLNGHSTREASFSVADPSHLHSMIAVLSSDLFWWWYTVSSNCRHLNPSDVQQFPLPASALEDQKLRELGAEYLGDIVRHSSMRTRRQRQTGDTQTQTFCIRKTRPIILRINRALAPHYALDDEELDFVTQFDLSFRMTER